MRKMRTKRRNRIIKKKTTNKTTKKKNRKSRKHNISRNKRKHERAGMFKMMRKRFKVSNRNSSYIRRSRIKGIHFVIDNDVMTIKINNGKYDASILKDYYNSEIKCIIISNKSYIASKGIKVLQFEGEEKDNTIINNACFHILGGGIDAMDGSWWGDGFEVNFKNLTIISKQDKLPRSTQPEPILSVVRDTYVNLENCNIINNPFGLYVSDGARVFLTNCKISNDLIRVSGSTSFLDITNCRVGDRVIPKERRTEK